MCIGNTAFPYLNEGCSIYLERLKHYSNFEMLILPDIKNAASKSSQQLIEEEGKLIFSKLSKDDLLIVLDENGKQFDSVELSEKINSFQIQQKKRIVFLIGGAYGISDKVKSESHLKWSLSKLTFSHQMIRLLALEQIYRAFTILKGEPYHHKG